MSTAPFSVLSGAAIVGSLLVFGASAHAEGGCSVGATQSVSIPAPVASAETATTTPIIVQPQEDG